MAKIKHAENNHAKKKNAKISRSTVYIIYGCKFLRILKTVDLAGINFSHLLQLLVLFIQKFAMNLILAGAIFTHNGTIC